MKTKSIGGTLILLLISGAFFCMGNGMGMVGQAAQPIVEGSDPRSCCPDEDASGPESAEASHACCFSVPTIAGSTVAMPNAPLHVLAFMPVSSVLPGPLRPPRIERDSRAPPLIQEPFSSPTASRAPPVA